MNEETEVHEKLDLLIRKNAKLNRYLFGITLTCLATGIFMSFLRQKELLSSNDNLKNSYAALEKNNAAIYASYKLIADSFAFAKAEIIKSGMQTNLGQRTDIAGDSHYQDDKDNQIIDKKNIALPQQQKKHEDIAAYPHVHLPDDIESSSIVASNMTVTPITEKKNGREKVTTTAKKVDKLVIGFDIDNKLLQPSQADIYVIMTDPAGKTVNVENLGSGTFTTWDKKTERSFTVKLPVEFEPGKKKNVQFVWKQNSDFMRGTYKIEVYYKGRKIGESMRDIKKGGLFG